MKVFEFICIYHPRRTKKQEEDGTGSKSEIIVDLQRVLAKSDKEATMLAARSIPEKYADKLDQVEIAIRPF